MMRKKCFIGIMVAFFVCFIATSCTKKESSAQEVMTENFNALVMGGKEIDPNHTWNTAITTPISVSVNLDADASYKVYLYTSNPAIDADAHYVGMACLKSGESKTVSANAPVGTTQFYAACYDKDGNAISKPVSSSEVNFSGIITSGPGTPTPTTGNNWSVPVKDMPSTSRYTSGPFVNPTEIDPELPESAELHILIGNEYKGIVPTLGSHSNRSLYVTGTWTLTFDQRIANGNAVVVGDGGKIVIPKGFKLTTATENPGVIYVLPGGEITGEGTVEFTDGASTFSYNSGTISTNEILLSSGTLYNNGTIGSSSQTTSTSLVGEQTLNTPGQFFNYSNAYFLQTSGGALSILNAGRLYALVNMSISEDSRLDDGAYIECGTLSLQGKKDTGSVLFMGNASYLNCIGSCSINQFGVWGPSGNGYHDNAFLKLGSCSSCKHTSGNASTYLLDHVQLRVAAGFTGIDMIDSWINGNGGNIDMSRQTCYYNLESKKEPSYTGMYYIFEFPDESSNREFDYNDLVLLVSAPYDNGDGTFSSFINIAAIGTKLNATLFYNNQQIGQEVHKVMSIDEGNTVNVGSITMLPRYIGEITFGSSTVDISSIPFSVHTEKTDGTSSNTYSQVKESQQAPLYIAVNADSKGKWRWVKEGSNIGLAFLKFSSWAANQRSDTDWYQSSYGSSSHLVSAW